MYSYFVVFFTCLIFKYMLICFFICFQLEYKIFNQAFLHLQLGTLGAGNHYAEIQVVDEIFNDYAAKKMGIDHKGQVCVMIHSGSRGLGHQVATGMF